MIRVWILLLLSCTAPEPECTSTAACGDGQACIEGRCEEVECVGQGDCAIETFCNPATYTCDIGCASSDDCMIGDRCDAASHTCVQRECRDTQLDCDLGERCDMVTGVCARDPAPYCEPCNFDEDCGDGGLCARISPRGPARCFLRCSPEAFDPCPAGLQCSYQQTADGEPDGFRCVGLCDRL